jgi:DNA ligase-1
MITQMIKLYKRAVNGKVLEHTIELKDNCYRTVSGYTDGVKTTTEWTCCKGKNIGKKNETTDEEQAAAEAMASWKKKLERGYFMNIKDIDKGTIFKPMLANKWEDKKDKLAYPTSYPLYSQPKLDGVRCIVNSEGMWTRTGKRILSAPHIFAELEDLFEKDPELILDGELYADKLAHDFNKIVSLVKKTKPTMEDLNESANTIEYHIYDMPSCDAPFSQRFVALNELHLSPCCKIVPTYLVEKPEQIDEYYLDYMADGYEGQMIRFDGYYENKRSNNLLKHKSFCDEEYTIVDVEEGVGNKSGMVGAFVFENADGKRFNAAPKFSWDECKQMLKDKKKLIGKSATVKYFNITPDGVPRFPTVINIDRESYE